MSWLAQASAETSMTNPVHCWPSQKPTEIKPLPQMAKPQPILLVYDDSNLRYMVVQATDMNRTASKLLPKKCLQKESTKR